MFVIHGTFQTINTTLMVITKTYDRWQIRWFDLWIELFVSVICLYMNITVIILCLICRILFPEMIKLFFCHGVGIYPCLHNLGEFSPPFPLILLLVHNSIFLFFRLSITYLHCSHSDLSLIKAVFERYTKFRKDSRSWSKRWITKWEESCIYCCKGRIDSETSIFWTVSCWGYKFCISKMGTSGNIVYHFMFTL